MSNKIDENPQTLLITYSLEIGEGEAKEDSALIRPFRVLYKKNKKNPVGKISFQYYSEGNNPLRVFGTFCLTPNGKLLFFPSLNNERKILWSSQGKNFQPPLGQVDHFTADENLTTWHVTTLNGYKKEKPENWLGNFTIKEVEKGLYYWFGLSVKSQDILEKAPKDTKFIFNGLPNEVALYGEWFTQSRDKSVFNILKTSENESRVVNENTFLHFDVLIDKRKHPVLAGLSKISCAPSQQPILRENVTPSKNFPVRLHEVKLPKFDGTIHVAVSLHQGKLSEDSIIINPN